MAHRETGDCVLVDGLTVYVGESGQIEKFDRTGKPTGLLEDKRLGVVTAVGIHDADVFVGDATNRCIRRYDHSGKWLSDIGKSNNTKGFLIPNGQIDFGVDENGVIHVANPGKHRVERYSPTGELIDSFGKFGMQHAEDFGGCCNPTNLALLPQGWVVVTEKAEPRLKIYDGQGRLLAMIGPEAFDPQCKNMDVAVDHKGRVYVADTARLHICVFEPEPETTAPASGRSP